jgi:hypothetical protein
VAPYRAPERSLKKNAEFNLHVSRLRIRSEHAIGFLKGRFPSLKGLRLQINNACMHRIATYWISACIAVHMFAFRIEREECGNDDGESYLDQFLEEDNTSSSPTPPPGDSGLDSNSDGTHEQTRDRGRALRAAKKFRSSLRHRLLRVLERKRAYRVEVLNS